MGKGKDTLKIGLYLACYPELEETWSYVPPLGLGYLSSYAKHHLGGKVEFVIELHLEDLLEHRPDLVCMTYVTHNATFARRQAEKIKQAAGLPVIVGGPHISTLPDKLEAPFDVAVLNEGEETFLELLKLYLATGSLEPGDLAGIKGLLYRDGDGSLVRTPPRPTISELDTIPYPDRDLMFEAWRAPRRDKPVQLQIMTSRGCPYDCSFCSTIIHWGRGFRYPSNEYVVNEIALMRERYDPVLIDIFDDLYIVRKDRVMEINRMLRERGLHEGVEFTCFARSNLIDEELLEDMARTNFKIIHVGMESGSDEMLIRFNKQAAGMKQNREAIQHARNTGIEYTSCFILGAPGERREDIYETMAFVEDGMDVFYNAHFTPLLILPGTPVWEWGVKEFGLNADNLAEKAIAMEPEDVADEAGLARFSLERIPYFNEKCIPREEFNILLRMGWLMEKAVINNRYNRWKARKAMAASYSAQHTAESVPIRDIVKEKTRRRLRKLMPNEGGRFDDTPRQESALVD